MGLELLAAAAAFPEIDEVACMRGGPVRRPAAPPGRMALDAALGVCQRALERAGCCAADVGLILSKGVSPSHVALTADIVGPRLAHPLQHALRAQQAFVFDLLDSPWVAALDTAEVFLQDTSRQVALLVHSESSAASVEADPGCGFSLSDGVGALVVRLTQVPARATFLPVRTNKPAARLLVNPPGAARRTRMVFDVDAALALEVRAAMQEALAQQLEQLGQRSSPLIVAEQWFAGHAPELGLSTLRGAEPEQVSLGALSVPAALARHLGQREKPPGYGARPAEAPLHALLHEERRQLLILGFDPFRLQVSCRSVLASMS